MKDKVRKINYRDDGFANRLAICAKRVGNASKLSEKAGFSKTSMSDYIKGSSEPHRSRLIDIANAAGVSILWLTTGEGEPDQNHSESQSTEGIAEKTVKSAVMSLTSYLSKRCKELHPETMGEAVVLACSLANEDGIVTESAVSKLMKFKGDT